MDNLDKKEIKVENNFYDDDKIYELYDFFKKIKFKDSETKNNIESDLNLSFSIFQKPIKYKEILIYPLTMKYYFFAKFLFSCLTLRKNTSGDINAISMSYFDYLFYLVEKGEVQYVEFLYQLLLIILKKEQYAKYNGEIIRNYDGKPLENIIFFSDDNKHYKLGILKDNIKIGVDKLYGKEDYYIYNSNDFDKIRNIICEQNDLELPDETLRKEVLDEIERAEEFLYKDAMEKIGTIEDKINSLSVVGGIPRNEIMEMSIKNFNNCIERLDVYINYSLSTLLSPNMSEESRAKISKECSTWLAKTKKSSRYDRVKSSLNDLKQKLSANN